MRRFILDSFPKFRPQRTSRTARGHSAIIAGMALVVVLAALLAGCANGSHPATQGNVSGAGAQPTANPYALTYVAIGASDAFGVGTDDPTQDNWPNVLAGELGHLRAQVHLINLGIPGSTVADAQDEELPVALGAHPDIVTVWLAVNDLADNVPLATYASQLSALLGALRTQTHARVYVGNLPDLTQLPYFANDDPAALRSTIAAWNAAIARDAQANGATLVNLHAYSDLLAQNPSYIAPDGLHPSTQGAQALAGVFARAIGG